MDNWEKLSKEIEIETRDYFRDKQINVPELVELLRKVLAARVDEGYKLSGVAVNIPKAMHDILDDDTTRKGQLLNFEILIKFEPFLRKLLFLLDAQKLREITEAHRGLAAVINALHLNPNRINLQSTTGNDRRSYEEYDYQLLKVYTLRNVEAHEMELWGNRELAGNIESVFIFYLEVLNRHKDALEKVLVASENDFSGYVTAVIGEFEERARRFISTETVEDFSVFESYAIEHKDVTAEDEEERSGTVDDIRKSKLPEKRMILWGEAGMGKSTTLQYLSYIDAKEYKDGKSNLIPVYVPLGMLINKEETLEQYICKKLDVEFLTGIEMFKIGKVTLFLDGVNEIPADNESGIHMHRLKEIQNILDAYPQMLVIVSNRPDSYNYFKGIPVFRLQKMNLRKIEEFLQRNTDDEGVRETILDGVKQNQRLLQLVGTPLMATRLVEIVSGLKELPQSEGTIIKKFLESLYKREHFEKMDSRFDEFKINHLLTYLASYGFRKNGTNSGLTNFEVLECFANCMERYHFSYDSTYALDILLNLGVLSGDRNREIIVFSHQAYQDYYLSCADKDNSKRVQQIMETSAAILTTDAMELETFYRENAKDEKHEKSIIYRLHTMDRASRNEGIALLAKYNLLLAAKAVASGEADAEIESYIVELALDKMKSSKEADCLEATLVFLELGRIRELEDNIAVVIATKGDVIKDIVMKLNGEQSVVFLDALSRQRFTKDGNLPEAIGKAIAAFCVKDYEYSWSKADLPVIRAMTERLNRLLKFKPATLLRYYMAFHVPKECLRSDIDKIVKRSMRKSPEFAEAVIKKYNLDIDTGTESVIEIVLSSNSRAAIKTACSIIQQLPSEEKYEVIQKFLPQLPGFRRALFLQLCKEQQFEITKRCNVYFVVKNQDEEYPVFLTGEEADKLLFEMGLYECYAQDVKVKSGKRSAYDPLSFVEFLRKVRPDGSCCNDKELLQSSTFKDFCNFERSVQNTVQKGKKARQASKQGIGRTTEET